MVSSKSLRHILKFDISKELSTTRDPKTFCLRVLFFSEFQVSMKQPVISKSRWMLEFRYSLVFGE